MATKPKIDLDAMSAEELVELIAQAERKRDEKLDQAKSDLLTEMQAKAAQLGLRLEELMPQRGRSAPSPAPSGRKRRRDAGAPVAAKYRGPNGEEWTGRGRMPNWLRTAEASGQARDTFRI